MKQDIVEISYSYIPLLSLSLASKPIMLIQLPEKLATVLNENVEKRVAILTSLTGQITEPNTLISNKSYSLQKIPSTISLSYDFGISSLVVRFPEKFLNLSLLSKWQITIQFDVKELESQGIKISSANNGKNYLVSGSFIDNTTGFQLIDLLTFNKKQEIIDTPMMNAGI